MALWIQTVAIVLSACAAIWLVLSSQVQSKRRATVEMLLNLRLDSDYISIRDRFKSLIDNEDNLAKYASKECINSENAVLIIKVLSFHEYVATAIFEDAFDENIYKRMTCSICIRDWDRLEDFVSELRRPENKFTLFQEFEILAKKWKRAPLQRHL